MFVINCSSFSTDTQGMPCSAQLHSISCWQVQGILEEDAFRAKRREEGGEGRNTTELLFLHLQQGSGLRKLHTTGRQTAFHVSERDFLLALALESAPTHAHSSHVHIISEAGWEQSLSSASALSTGSLLQGVLPESCSLGSSDMFVLLSLH